MIVGAVHRPKFRSFSMGLAVGAAALLGGGAPAQAVVVEQLNLIQPPPSNGWVGNWFGSSGVPVAPNWVLSARHVGGAVGNMFVIRGVQYQALEIRHHPTLDLQLIRVAGQLPGWHQIAPQQAAGTEVVLGGCGATTQFPLLGGLGWDWSGSPGEAWGRNRIQVSAEMLRVRFDAPGASGWVLQEATFAIHDSGAGLFVAGPGGQLLLAGTAVSVSGAGASEYGSSCYCVSLHTAQSWITSVIGSVSPPSNCNLFAYLLSWFERSPSADYNGNGTVDVTDLFDYLTAWFQGC